MSDSEDDAARALANANLQQQPQIRGTSSIGVEDYVSGQDFEEYADLFVSGVKLATNARDQQEVDDLCLQWLPLKLDAPALAVYKQADKTSWSALKEDLIKLLVDPQEKFKWQARLTTIKWDGKESFHALASRVKRAVDKYDKEMPQAFKDRDYYQRFCDALPKYYRGAIHMGCNADERNIDNAKELALRAQLAIADPPGKTLALEGASASTEPFTGAAMRDNHISAVERTLSAMQDEIEDLAAMVRKLDQRLEKLEHYLSRIEDRDGCTNYDSRDYRETHQNSRGNYRRREGSPDECDSFDQRKHNRPHNDNHDRRGGGDSRRSYQEDQHSSSSDSEEETVRMAMLAEKLRKNLKKGKKSGK